MSSQTTNYKLIIPEGQDNADISVVGENMEIIDAQLKKINDEKLAKTGGDLSGNLTVKGASYPKIAFVDTTANTQGAVEASPHGIALIAANVAGDYTNYRSLMIRDSGNPQGALDVALQFLSRVNGVTQYHNIYHTGNKPTAADVGAVPAINANSASFNMDNVIKSGAHLAMYITGNNTLGTPQKYGKTTLVSAAILSYGNEADYGVQVAFLSGGGVMTRGLSKGVLSEWTAFYHEGNAAAIVADATLEE